MPYQGPKEQCESAVHFYDKVGIIVIGKFKFKLKIINTEVCTKEKTVQQVKKEAGTKTLLHRLIRR